jgi:hypothetical protein
MALLESGAVARFVVGDAPQAEGARSGLRLPRPREAYESEDGSERDSYSKR